MSASVSNPALPTTNFNFRPPPLLPARIIFSLETKNGPIHSAGMLI